MAPDRTVGRGQMEHWLARLKGHGEQTAIVFQARNAIRVFTIRRNTDRRILNTLAIDSRNPIGPSPVRLYGPRYPSTACMRMDPSAVGDPAGRSMLQFLQSSNPIFHAARHARSAHTPQSLQGQQIRRQGDHHVISCDQCRSIDRSEVWANVGEKALNNNRRRRYDLAVRLHIRQSLKELIRYVHMGRCAIVFDANKNDARSVVIWKVICECANRLARLVWSAARPSFLTLCTVRLDRVEHCRQFFVRQWFQMTRSSSCWSRDRGVDHPSNGLPVLRPAWALADLLREHRWGGCGLSPDDIDWWQLSSRDLRDCQRAARALGLPASVVRTLQPS